MKIPFRMAMGFAMPAENHVGAAGLVAPGIRPSARLLTGLAGQLSKAWHWYQGRRTAQLRPGRLRVAESVSLGEKRFVAVIEVDGKQFLVGGCATGVSLLSRLDPQHPEPAGEVSCAATSRRPFGEVLRQSIGQSTPQSHGSTEGSPDGLPLRSAAGL